MIDYSGVVMMIQLPRLIPWLLCGGAAAWRRLLLLSCGSYGAARRTHCVPR